jgi:hypothetical protein
MNIIGQPKNYSDILQRIFISNCITGVFCIYLLGLASPEIKSLLEIIDIKADLGIIKEINILYILLPLLFSGISLLIKLHDRISDIFNIRLHFDVNYLLQPLLIGVGVENTKDNIQWLVRNRRDLMYKIFYPYAGFISPIIDEQLVRSAADSWGWYWSLLESLIILVITDSVLLYYQSWNYVIILSIILFIDLILLSFQMNKCKKQGQYQINAILEDDIRKMNIARIINAR